MRKVLQERIRIIRKLRLQLYPGQFDRDEVLSLIDTLDPIFEDPIMADLREVYENEFRPTVYINAYDRKTPTRDEFRDSRALLTEFILSIFDKIENEK